MAIFFSRRRCQDNVALEHRRQGSAGSSGHGVFGRVLDLAPGQMPFPGVFGPLILRGVPADKSHLAIDARDQGQAAVGRTVVIRESRTNVVDRQRFTLAEK